MDDGDVSEQTDEHVMRSQIRDRHRPRGLREEAFAIDQGTVWVGARKIRRAGAVGEAAWSPSIRPVARVGQRRVAARLSHAFSHE